MIASAEPPEALPLTERTRVLLPGLYAWMLTVGLPVMARGVRTGPRLTAAAALVALLLALSIVGQRLTVARVFGIYVFVLCSALTWALLGSDLSPAHLDRVRTALGTLGWVLYAFGWGRVRTLPEADRELQIAPGAPLIPRSRLHARAVPIVAFAVCAALVCEGLAFRVDRPEHAVLAHGAAVACALLVLSAGSRIALAQGTRVELASPAQRLNAVALRGALLALLFGLGLVWAALR
jgi:hypothetical protein